LGGGHVIARGRDGLLSVSPKRLRALLNLRGLFLEPINNSGSLIIEVLGSFQNSLRDGHWHRGTSNCPKSLVYEVIYGRKVRRRSTAGSLVCGLAGCLNRAR
jgi:hypothetical protein